MNTGATISSTTLLIFDRFLETKSVSAEFQSKSIASPMNVLVYGGAGTCDVSVKCTMNSISAILSPFFDVKCVDSNFLNNEPWEKYCRCIVIPGGADLSLH